MTPEDTEQLGKAIEELMPKSLDDIVRRNRDKAGVRLATDAEIMILETAIESLGLHPDNVMSEWRIIVLEIYPSDSKPGGIQPMLLGSLPNGHARITSVVKKIDLDTGLVITQSGTLYGLGARGEGEPRFEHLAMICSAFHSWGFGHTLGAPHFFIE